MINRQFKINNLILKSNAFQMVSVFLKKILEEIIVQEIKLFRITIKVKSKKLKKTIRELNKLKIIIKKE